MSRVSEGCMDDGCWKGMCGEHGKQRGRRSVAHNPRRRERHEAALSCTPFKFSPPHVFQEQGASWPIVPALAARCDAMRCAAAGERLRSRTRYKGCCNIVSCPTRAGKGDRSCCRERSRHGYVTQHIQDEYCTHELKSFPAQVVCMYSCMHYWYQVQRPHFNKSPHQQHHQDIERGSGCPVYYTMSWELLPGATAHQIARPPHVSCILASHKPRAERYIRGIDASQVIGIPQLRTPVLRAALQ